MLYSKCIFVTILLLFASSFVLQRFVKLTTTAKPTIPELDYLRSFFDASKSVSGDDLAITISGTTKLCVFDLHTELDPDFVLQTQRTVAHLHRNSSRTDDRIQYLIRKL